MEKLNSLFKNISDRLSNPLIFSFIISWLVINWKVPIGLIFYKSDLLIKDGYSSYFDLISKSYSFSKYFTYPLLIALFYTFIFPLIRNGINAFNTWIHKWGNDWNLNIAKDGKIPISRYITLRDKYLEQTKLLEDLYNSESGVINENAKLKNENITIKNARDMISLDLDSWVKGNQTDFLNGQWELTYFFTKNKIEISQSVLISNGNFLITYDSRNEGNTQQHFSISYIFNNISLKEICLILNQKGKANSTQTILLKYNDSITELDGEYLFPAIVNKSDFGPISLKFKRVER